MDSGSAAPTLRPGVNETLAEKDLISAILRCGAVSRAVLPSSLWATWRADSFAVATRRAFILARERAGRSRPARTAMMAMTTRSSMRVKPRREVFIQCLCLCYVGLDNAPAEKLRGVLVQNLLTSIPTI